MLNDLQIVLLEHCSTPNFDAAFSEAHRIGECGDTNYEQLRLAYFGNDLDAPLKERLQQAVADVCTAWQGLWPAQARLVPHGGSAVLVIVGELDAEESVDASSRLVRSAIIFRAFDLSRAAGFD